MTARTRNWILLTLGLGLLTAGVFVPVYRCGFVNVDDPAFVTSNPVVLAGLKPAGIAWAFQLGHGDYWHPLAWISLMLDVSLFGPGPAGMHLTNVFFHVSNVMLLFLLLVRWTGKPWRSAVVAALFALHPLRVESVAWITERKDVLSTFFWLLGLGAYTRYAANRKERPGMRWLFYSLTTLFFVLGLMAKAMLITFPATLLLLDLWPLARIAGFQRPVPASRSKAPPPPPPYRIAGFRHLWLEKIPWFALSLLFVVLTYREQQRGNTGFDTGEALLPLSERIKGALIACERYLAKTFWPAKLTVNYPRPAHWDGGELFVAVILVGVLCWLAIRSVRRRPYWFVGWFWFLGTLLPVIGLTKGWLDFMADRFTYVPQIGIFVVAVWSISEWAKASRGRQQAAVAAGIAAVVASGILSIRQIEFWRDSGRLFEHAVDVTDNNAFAEYSLGCYLQANGRIHDALQHYRRAVKIVPENVQVLNNLGSALYAEGDLVEAEAACRRALQLDPHNADAHYNLANVLSASGNAADAISCYIQAIGEKTNFVEAVVNLGSTYAAMQRFDEAANCYERALVMDPRSAEAWGNLGVIRMNNGKIEEAIACFHKAIQIAPDDTNSHYNLGRALAGQGHWADAAQEYRAVLRANPNDAASHYELGRALARVGDHAAAVSEFTEALRLNPDYSEAKEQLKELDRR
jgi:tetratricopeptide (TPR) repeat protein